MFRDRWNSGKLDSRSARACGGVPWYDDGSRTGTPASTGLPWGVAFTAAPRSLNEPPLLYCAVFVFNLPFFERKNRSFCVSILMNAMHKYSAIKFDLTVLEYGGGRCG